MPRMTNSRRADSRVDRLVRRIAEREERHWENYLRRLTGDGSLTLNDLEPPASGATRNRSNAS